LTHARPLSFHASFTNSADTFMLTAEARKLSRRVAFWLSCSSDVVMVISLFEKYYFISETEKQEKSSQVQQKKQGYIMRIISGGYTTLEGMT